VIALQKGPSSDQFFLTFEQIGSNTHAYTNPVVAVPVPVAGAPVPDLGVRTFERIYQTMAKLTGVSPLVAGVSSTYQSVQQSLPSIPDLDAFSPAAQTSISQLAIAYCSALVDDPTLRPKFFGASFDPTQGGAYFNTQSNRDLVINALYNNLVGGSIASQPSLGDVQAELNNLITQLTPSNYASTANRSGIVTKAACAAVLGSASTLVQ
jgi:hypothetical protein